MQLATIQEAQCVAQKHKKALKRMDVDLLMETMKLKMIDQYLSMNKINIYYFFYFGPYKPRKAF